MLLPLLYPTNLDFSNMTTHHLRGRRTLIELNGRVDFIFQAGVPLGLCITHWPCGYGVQLEEIPQTLNAGENVWWVREERCTLKQGTPCWHCLSHPPPTRFALYPAPQLLLCQVLLLIHGCCHSSWITTGGWEVFGRGREVDWGWEFEGVGSERIVRMGNGWEYCHFLTVCYVQ